MRNSKVLLWMGLFGVVLVSLWLMLPKLDVAKAQSDPNYFDNFIYTWLASNSETLYGIDFSEMSEMEIIWDDDNVFRMSQVPVVVNEAVSPGSDIIDITRNSVNAENSNILWGDRITIEGSENITIIWWWNNIVHPNNTNVTFFWWADNQIHDWGSNEVPNALLGWSSNIVEDNRGANVLLWWLKNTIRWDSRNLNILWWNEIHVHGENTIVWWSNVEWDFNNAFIFNDGEKVLNSLAPADWLFILNVENWVWFGEWVDWNWGIASKWAVMIWGVENINCMNDAGTIWIQGTMDGCLVWCTSESADQWKWELLDHSNDCSVWCKGDERCITAEVEDKVEDYTSFCTQWLVFTGNAHMCNPGWVNSYYNVVFETYLIDSNPEDSCDNYAGDNQCAYQCDNNYHLTWDVTGKKEGVTMCFEDCERYGTKYKHNEMITGYNETDITSEGGLDNCGKHKKVLMCVDGAWYETDDSSHKATIVNTQYIHETCTLHASICDTTKYNLTRKQVVNEKEDFMKLWQYDGIIPGISQEDIETLNIFKNDGEVTVPTLFRYERIKGWKNDNEKVKNWIRWKYELCVDYVPWDPDNIDLNPYSTAPGNEVYYEKPYAPDQYHYMFKDCQHGYTKAPEDDVCRKDCTYKWESIKHGETIQLFTWTSATCNNTCHATDFQCYDWTLYVKWQTYPSWGFPGWASYVELKTQNWKFIQGTPQSSTVYTELNCVLNEQTCTGYPTTQWTYNANQNFGYYTQCQKYNPSWLFACTATDKMYQLQYCYANHYQVNDTCPSCPTACWNCVGWWYVSNTWATALNQCSITCSRKNYVAEPNWPCVECPIGTYPAWTVNYLQTVQWWQIWSCNGCTNKPDHSTYTSNWSQANDCAWQCDAWYYQNGNSCPICPAWYYCQWGNKISCTTVWSNYTSDPWASSQNDCYKWISVTFYVHGNGWSDQTLTCKDFNGSSNGCSITAPNIIPAAGFTVIWWGEAADMPINDWTPGTNKVVTSDAVYFARTYQEFHRTAKFYKNWSNQIWWWWTYNGYHPIQCTVIGYNGDTTLGCSVTSPSINPGVWFTALWYNTDSNAHSSSWTQNTSKYITGTVTYYAIRKKDVTWTFIKGNWVQSIGSTSATCTIWNSATTCDILQMPTVTCSTNYWSPSWSPSSLNELSSNATATATCQPQYTCSPWKYLKKNTTTCYDCTAWYYCPWWTWTQSSSNQWIYACSAWEYSSAWQSSCSNCPCGTYSSAHSSSCTSCGDWKYSSQWSTSQSQCYSCTASKPTNAQWTNAHACSNNDCTWACNNGYAGSDCHLVQDQCYTQPCYAAEWNVMDPGNYVCSKCHSVVTPYFAGDGCWSSAYPSCFVSWTQVTMSDGSKKNIEDVVEWDQLLWNNWVNTVLQLYRPLLRDQWLISINGSRNFVTPSHPFMTTEWWKSLAPEESMQMMDEEVKLLELWDILITEDWYEVVESLVWMSASPDTQLYNFKVDGDNTYYADGYLVHNKAQPWPCTHTNPLDSVYEEQIKTNRGGVDP